MAGVQGSRLAIAVANAGGLGSLPAALLTPEVLRSELLTMRAGTTAPYNVNFFCHQAPVPHAARDLNWKQRLKPYYDEMGLAIDEVSTSATRTPFDAAQAELIAEFKPAVVSFHFGLPGASLLARVKSWGAIVMSSATTVAEARWLEGNGADVIIAQGAEAGGHRGMFLTNDITTQIGTFALVPQVVRAVSVPVVAAGGIADAQGVRAALELGATAVQVGTSFLLCDECDTSAVHRAALKSEGALHTVLTNVFTGRPARCIVNELVREVGPMSLDAPEFPLASTLVAPLRKHAEAMGSSSFSPIWAGQNATGCREISAAQITLELASMI